METLLQIPGCSPAIVAYALEIYNGNTSLAALFLQNGTVSSIPAWRIPSCKNKIQLA